jgi:hypothetical protein
MSNLHENQNDMKKIHNEQFSYILSKTVLGISFFYVYSRDYPSADSMFTDYETALVRCKYLSK